ncbi:hypothetical protein TNCV_570551 [Trichonephila clavipes]|nr:hypothetical protein TNCV_570551 [Trichonephila clavipes]
MYQRLTLRDEEALGLFERKILRLWDLSEWIMGKKIQFRTLQNLQTQPDIQFIQTIIKQGVDSSNGRQNEIAVVPDFHKRILFSDEAHFWLNGYVNKQNCRIWSEANPQVYVETPLHPEKLTVWYALWAGGILLQKR